VEDIVEVRRLPRQVADAIIFESGLVEGKQLNQGTKSYQLSQQGSRVTVRPLIPRKSVIRISVPVQKEIALLIDGSPVSQQSLEFRSLPVRHGALHPSVREQLEVALLGQSRFTLRK
jgi:hypothetical protein